MATLRITHPTVPVKLAPPRLKLAEFARAPYRVEPEAGVTLDDVLEPEFLAHVADRLRPGDKLEIMPECMSWYAEALVVDATRLSARIQVILGPVAIDAAEQVLASDVFEARWISPSVRFGVVRKSDGAYMVRHLPTKADADQWIAQRVGMKVRAASADAGPAPATATAGGVGKAHPKGAPA